MARQDTPKTTDVNMRKIRSDCVRFLTKYVAVFDPMVEKVTTALYPVVESI